MGEEVKAKTQNFLTRAHARKRQFSDVFHPLRNKASRRLEDRVRSSIIRFVEPIATAAAPLRRPMRRAQTHIEAVRNRGLRHGLDFGLCDENDAFQKK